MSERKWSKSSTPPWPGLMSCAIAGMFVWMTLSPIANAEYVILWAKADGGSIMILGLDNEGGGQEGVGESGGGDGSGGGAANPYGPRPPCHEWSHSPEGWVPAYDPETQGCCANPQTGKEEITNNPDSDDPCGQPVGDGVNGFVGCQNGKPTPCVVTDNFPPEWDQDLAEKCIEEHENDHMRDETPGFCKGCEKGKMVTHKDARPKGECSAYQAQLDCIGDCPPDDDGCEEFKDDSKGRRDAWCDLAGL